MCEEGFEVGTVASALHEAGVIERFAVFYGRIINRNRVFCMHFAKANACFSRKITHECII